MESLELKLFNNVYHGRRVLVTGHTGFKGSWLALWLNQLGAKITGFALPPSTRPNHWELLQLSLTDLRGDIRDTEALQRVIHEYRPEIIFHLSAQPLVRRSYQNPLETWSTNVIGTVNLLEACRQAADLLAVVIVTTDKVYLNNERNRGYNEDDKLGGHDPYSASKAASELVVESYRKAFFSERPYPLVATARAGNVIGGGDWSEDRLIPDVVRTLDRGVSLEIRFPDATRPWQHVLECLAAYLLLGQHLLAGNRNVAEAWNFGPDPDGNRSVAGVLAGLQSHWPEFKWHRSTTSQPHEAGLLYLDNSKAKARLGWKPLWNFERALTATAEWYQKRNATNRIPTLDQLNTYIESAVDARCPWASH